MTWTRSQLSTFARDLEDEVGRAWSLLGPKIRAALIDATVLQIVLAQDAETISIERVRVLREGLEQRLREKPFGRWVDDDDRPHRRRDGTLVGGVA